MKINYHEILKTEESLDNSDLEMMRNLGKQMVDDMVDYLQDIKNKPAWKPIPQDSKNFLNEDLPESGAKLTEVYKEFSRHILPYNGGNIHPRYFSWVQGTGTLTGAFADLLASALNPNLSHAEHAATYVDIQVVNWAKQMMGFPKSASGILLSGSSMANITALIVARNSFISEGTELNVRKNGLKNLSAQMVLYCSSETHNSMQKAAEAIGLGSDAMRKIAVNDKYEIKIDQLEKAILKDKAQGLIPFCVVANCGSVNTGAIDDLNAIYDLCQKYNLWMHVDGAFGAAAKLTDEFSERLKIIEKADSLAFDFHKWFYVNYEVGCLLVRDAKKHRAAFATAANYLVTHERGLISGPDGMSNYGLELSRGFKALKIWMMFKEYGSSKFKKLIRQNIAQVHYLGDILRAEKKLELLNDPVLNVVCYRFNHFPSDHILSETEATYLDNLNKELLQRLQEQGIALPSATTLNNHYAIRVCITNHRTRKSDLEILAKESVRIGADILKENRI